MELTKEQILQIDNYISACGIKYYDVKAEIVDHFASILELRLEEEPNLDLKKTIVEEHKKFSDNGFKKLLETKTKAIHNRFLKLTFQNFKSFFKLPKIIITVFIYLLIYKLMVFFNDKELFFQILAGFAFLLFTQLGIRIFLKSRKRKHNFLVLNRTSLFLQVVNNMVVWFHLIVSFRKEESYSNSTLNYAHLFVFVLMILFYCSGEYVYYQNRKQIQEQYPNVIV